jgi:hypothetical protein
MRMCIIRTINERDDEFRACAGNGLAPAPLTPKLTRPNPVPLSGIAESGAGGWRRFATARVTTSPVWTMEMAFEYALLPRLW